jgi:dTDP-glucose pyrophosphorylase
MQRTEPTIIPPTSALRRAMEALNEARVQIVLVTDEERRLLGSITDGDIRRALLAGATLDTAVVEVMNKAPTTMLVAASRDATVAMMRRRGIFQLPLVDENGRVVSLALLSDPRPTEFTDVPVVLMAGGLGRRLRPLTDDCPKPMLPIGGRPLLELVIERLKSQGFTTFYISVNYLGHKIEDYFGNGDQLDVNIAYLREAKQLGTGGALSLLPLDGIEHVAVMNGDVITDLSVRDLIEHHRFRGFDATMCVRQHRTTVPYGVVEFESDRFRATVEKPTLVHHINSGIYCLSRHAVESIPQDTFYDLPNLFSKLVSEGRECGVFQLTDMWFDIGNRAEYERAQKMFTD